MNKRIHLDIDLEQFLILRWALQLRIEEAAEGGMEETVVASHLLVQKLKEAAADAGIGPEDFREEGL